MQIAKIIVTLLPVLSTLIAVPISCYILKLNLRRYTLFFIINMCISSLCLTPLLSPLVFGKFLLFFPIIQERFTLSYFFFKLPILYDRVPAYLLVCLLALTAIYLCELVVGTYVTSVLLGLRFRRIIAFSLLTPVVMIVLTYSCLLVLSGLVNT